MKSITTVITLFVLGLFLSFSDGVFSCNIGVVSKCTSLLQADLGLSEGITAMPTTEQLNRMCSNISDFKACYEPEAALCKNDVVFSMTFGTIAKTVDYLCMEGYNDIVQYNSCWNRSDVVTATNMCHRQQNQMISDLQEIASGLDPADLRAVWCQIIDNTTSCMTEAIKERCGGGAVCVMHKMMTRSLKGVATFMQCSDVSSNCTTNSSSIVSTSSTSSTSSSSSTSSMFSTSTLSPTTKDNQPSNKGDLSGYSSGTTTRTNVVLTTMFLSLTMMFLNFM